MIATSLNTPSPSEGDPAEFHRGLAYFNRTRLSPAFIEPSWRSTLRDLSRMLEREGDFVEAERRRFRFAVAQVPRQASAFVDWFEGLRETGPGQGDPLFPWLAEIASLEDMRWFLHQEVAGEAGFEDLLALTQVKMPEVAKLEMARNYWDELGRGAASGMHGPMLGRLAAGLGLAPTPDDTVWEALALGNLMIALAANRRYAYQSVGALGAIELTAPGRATHVAQALRRLGLDGKSRVYFELHATLDIRHSEAWNREVIYNLVADDPRTAVPIAEGALLRLGAGLRCFERYRRALMPDRIS